MSTLSLVVPLYNEAGVFEPVMTGLLDAFRRAGEPLELVLVDNGSTDGTGAQIDALQRQAPEVRKVRVERNQGYGWGVLSGLEQGTGTHVGFMGGDGQIEPQDVVTVWQTMKRGDPDLAKVRRVVRQDGWQRRLVTACCNLIFPWVFGVRTRDINGTPKIMSADLYRTLHLRSKDWFLDAEVMIKCGQRGLQVVEVPVVFKPRAGGTSHVRFGAIVEFLVNIGRAWRGRLE